MSLQIGHEIDGYRIVGVLGKGGMGVVYEAEDIALSRAVALKAINPSLTQDELFIRRFQTEARTLAKVNSPYIVGVHALRKTDEGFFIVMEFVDGGTLEDRIEAGDIPTDESLSILRQMLHAFEHAHKVSVIHRDIKPANIMLTPAGVVKVTDFGLAKQSQPDMMSTVTQGVMGTLYYMSPEQVRGMGDVDHRSDLYSLGMTAYEMLAGKLPFPEGAGEFDIMRSIVDTDFPSPSEQNGDCPTGLSEIVMRAIHKNPDERFQTATEMLRAIDSWSPQPASPKEPPAPASARAGKEPTQEPLRRADKPAEVPTPEGDKPDSIKRLAWGLAIVIVAALAFIFLPDMLSSGPMGPGTASTLSLSTNPNEATVFLNSDGGYSSVGQTPLDGVIIDAQDGQAAFRVEKAGFISIDTTLNLSLAHHLELAAVESESGNEQPVVDPSQLDENEQTLENTNDETNRPPESGELVVNVSLPGSVFLDGTELISGQTVSTQSGLNTLVMRHPEYGTFEQSVSVTAGSRSELTCYFDGLVNIRATPVWGTVWLNGEATEFATDTQLQLGPGEYRVEVRKFEYETEMVEGPVGMVHIQPTCGDRMTFDFVFSLKQQ